MITRIQSVSDVITNSSSEVFIMSERNATYWEANVPDCCCSIEPITLEWLKSNLFEWESILDFLDIDKKELGTYIDRPNSWFGGYWEDPEEELWIKWLDEHKELIEKEIIDQNLYWVDIEDHFTDAYETICDAKSDALWSDSRH